MPTKTSKADTDEQSLVSYETAAQMLGVCSATVSNWVRRGDLKSITIGSRTKRIRRQALQDFINRREQEARE